jgi:PilZ domain-containing protein
MPIWAVQQQFPRYPIQLPLLHTVLSPRAGRPSMGWTRNLSESGACVELAEVVPADAALRLCFQMDHGIIEAEAQVVWAAAPDSDTGLVPHGVAFTRIAPDQCQVLRELFRTKGLTRHTGVRISSDLPVAYQAIGHAGQPRWGLMENISRGGLLLSLPELLRPGTRLKVAWQIAGEHLTAEGTIVWVEPTEGRTPEEPIRHGFRFTTLGLSTMVSLGLLLAGPM